MNFADRIVHWHRQHGRHDLPWQNTRDSYRIWVSEIMLQQTQVATVIPYFHRFMERFPTVFALAQATEDDVFGYWSGLGYYRRAQHLHLAAQQAVARHNAFPTAFAALQALPGIGRSTAAAIHVFSTGSPQAILDGNVKRVLARCFAVEGEAGRPTTERALWKAAESQLPLQQVEHYTQGLMDLGATVCTRVRPNCNVCPVADGCLALKQGRVDMLPSPRQRKALPERTTVMVLCVHNDAVLLSRRPAKGVWARLWSLPEMGSETEIVAQAERSLNVSVEQAVALDVIVHTFTHFKLQIRPYRLTVRPGKRASEEHRWFTFDQALAAGIPAPVRQLLEAQAYLLASSTV